MKSTITTARIYVISMLVLIGIGASAQDFYFGNDLSYANQMEDCGAVFKEDMQEKDVYQIFADHGTNLVRIRLWNEPSWQNDLVQPVGVKPQYNDIIDVRESISRAKKAGMQVMLGFQLSDFWADPGRQVIPENWVSVATDTAALADSVYNYIFQILQQLDADTLMPEVVKIGNENNGGILKHTILTEDYRGEGSVSSSWQRHAHLYKAAMRAVRDAGASSDIDPKICLHYAGMNYIESFYQRLIDYGASDFDIMGFSYYYSWHDASIPELGNTIRNLKSSFPAYDVMVAETGYLWTTEDFDDLPNIVTSADPAYLPISPEKQLEYMIDYTREVMNAGGIGVVFWEPAWVSTPCRTPWGQGSSHDHLVFFDPVNYNFMENGGGRWTEAQFYEDLSLKKIIFKVSTKNIDVPGKMYISGTMTGDPWKIEPMLQEAADLYNYTAYLHPGDTGAYYFLNDSAWGAREAVPAECADSWNTNRKYTMGNNDTIISYAWGTCLSAENPDDVQVTFKVDMTGEDVSTGVWMTGSMTGSSWLILSMQDEGNNIYSRTIIMHPGDSGAYYFMNDDVWGSRETVPAECATWWDSDRGYVIHNSDTTYAFTWGTCLPPGAVNQIESSKQSSSEIVLFPNPVTGSQVNVKAVGLSGDMNIKIIDLSGRILHEENTSAQNILLINKAFDSGTYLMHITNNERFFNKIFVVK